MHNNDDIDKYIFNRRKSFLLKDNTIINKFDNEKNTDENKNNKEMSKMNENDRYMIYENSKKYIDTNKIYNSRKFGLANIPNVSLDKGVKNVKKFEINIINMKNTQLDLPICIKTAK